MSANWGDEPEEVRAHRHVRGLQRPAHWYQRVDWFSLLMIMVAVASVCGWALWMSFHTSP